MKTLKLFLAGMTLAIAGLICTSSLNSLQAQCGTMGANQVDVHGAYGCAVNIVINHTGAGSPILCTWTTTGGGWPISIPAGATITSVTCNGVTPTATPTCLLDAGSTCGNVCLPGYFELAWDAFAQQLHIN